MYKSLSITNDSLGFAALNLPNKNQNNKPDIFCLYTEVPFLGKFATVGGTIFRN